jgi:hypothetical protein
MANQPSQARVIDPDCIPELICDGLFNVHVHSGLATLTFTHERPKAATLFEGKLNYEAVVRARITLTLPNLIALRDLLARIIQSPETPAPPAGGSTKH